MSIQKFRPGDIEFFTVQTTPGTSFISSSITGTTGSAYVYPRRSSILKDQFAIVTTATGAFTKTSNVGEVLQFAKLAQNTTELTDRVKTYLGVVGELPENPRNQAKQEVVRFTPGVNLDLNMTRKFVTTNVLMPYCAAFGTNYNFGFTNYHSLNFLTASGLPTGSAFLYPSNGSAATGAGTLVSASYIPSGAFTFDFYINPRYSIDQESSEFKAGTLFHMSGAYALSLVTGSSRDPNGLSDGYRIMLQLSSSATRLPSTIDPGNPPTLTFLSDDNSLTRGSWQHVSIRWGTESYNFGSGSFLVDGVEKGTFYIPSSSVAPKEQSGILNPCILTVGNFLECGQTGQAALFFSDRAQTRYGVPVFGSPLTTDPVLDAPNVYHLNHPLNAEVHELKIYNRYLSQEEIHSRSLTGPSLPDSSLLFYLPPFFCEESPSRSVDVIGGVGGVLVHPFQAVDGTTRHPFNVDLSFDTGGHYINLENFSRDFATGNYPRLINLSGQALNGNTEQLTCNGFLYASGSNRKASLSVLPNDNGVFMPNWFAALEKLSTGSYVTDNGDKALNHISLRNLYSLDSIYDLVPPSSGSATLNTDTASRSSIIASISGFDVTSSFGTLNPQRTPTILQRTQENNSLQVVMFDVSNLFYGNRILPGSFVLRDTNLSNSYGKVAITLKDDGFGSLYRADCTGSQATYNHVGNVFYDNGVVLITNPSLYWFGENGFECSFKGERGVHVMKARLRANPLELVSSSNPGWSASLRATDNASQFDQRYVYITDLYLHDDNLNVIAKTKLAQPVLKRSGEKLVFDVTLDW